MDIKKISPIILIAIILIVGYIILTNYTNKEHLKVTNRNISMGPVNRNISMGPVNRGAPPMYKIGDFKLVKSRLRDNYCMDVPVASKNNGVQLQAWTCHGGPNQLWKFDDKRRLVNKNSGKCLDIANANTENGGIVQQWDCHDGPNQKWSLTEKQTLVPDHSKGRCIGISASGKTDGTKLVLWDCPPIDDQKWFFG